jgi:hypothetical protein
MTGADSTLRLTDVEFCAWVAQAEGGVIERHVAAEGLGLGALVVRPEAEAMRITYGIVPSTVRHYPAEAFRPRQTRYTVAAPELAEASVALAARAGGNPGGGR